MRLGIDLGGTKIEIIALGDDGAVLTRERVPTPAGDYAGTIRAIAVGTRAVHDEQRLSRPDAEGVLLDFAMRETVSARDMALLKGLTAAYIKQNEFGPRVGKVGVGIPAIGLQGE